MHPDTLAQLRRDSVPLFNANRMKIGIFGCNVSNGGTISKAPTSHRPTFAHNLLIAQTADRLGLEFLVPFGRWKSFGGETEYNGDCMEVYTWAAALAARTEKIMLFATSHVSTMHPILAAKQGATIDHISNGRWGLNVVCGWYAAEMEMFGERQSPHDERYARAGEWVEVVKRLWCENHFDHVGEHYRVTDGYLEPKPVQQPYPVIVNAGVSAAGRDFSARHVDFNFITMDSVESAASIAADVRQRAHGYHREIGVLGYGFILVRDTECEARAAFNAIIEAGDWGAARNIMRVLGMESDSFNAQIEQFARRFVAGWGGYLMVGTPESVTAQFVALARAGVEGMALVWQDYAQELPYFGERVLPLMRQAGLRI
ncbi:MAG: LLM class flavin-dependent oxidoreductase [Gammaproteobacteria bacterium]|nr:LLM class flavin-dependent oxidoreductase [Gammaproteobacteria bacterium]